MRPFNQGPAQAGPMMAQAPQQAAPLNANNQGFGGHMQCFTNASGTYEEYTVKSVVCEGKNFGMPAQNFSSEMLRWDDYRQAKQINDGTPSMKTTFDTNPEGMMQCGLPFAGHREVTVKKDGMGNTDKINILYKVFVTHPRMSGASVQNFCSEMDRWDSMRAEKTINDGTPNMRQTFGDVNMLVSTDTDVSRKPTSSNANPSSLLGGAGNVTNATGLNQQGQFTGYQTETIDNKGTRIYNTYRVRCCKPIYEGQPVHNFSTEMLRWDDYRQAKQINDGTGPLQERFDVPPTATAAMNRMAGAAAPGGFGAPAAAPGGFGAPAAAPGGFGAPAAAPGGFGAPAAAPGGFGAPAAAPGGFGAPAAAPGGFGAPAAGGAFGRRF